jgi:hypothetical protein
VLLVVATDEVGGHVVGGPERGPQHERAARGEVGHLLERDERRPQHDGVADGVDAAASGAPGELRVLPRREELVVVTGELGELLDDHGPPAC